MSSKSSSIQGFDSWLEQIVSTGAVKGIADAAAAGGQLAVRGSVGSSTIVLAAALARHARRPILLVTAHLDDADEAADVLRSLGVTATRFPAVEVLPGETSVNLELLAERLHLVEELIEGSVAKDANRSGEDIGIGVVIAPVAALMQSVPRVERLSAMLRVLRVRDRIDPHELSQWLTNAGYDRVPAVDSPGEFAVRGGIIDIFPPGGQPSRIDLFGDEIEKICEFDLATMGSDRKLDRLELVGASPAMLQDDETAVSLLDHLPGGTIAMLGETIEIIEQGRSYFDRAADARGLFPPREVIQQVTKRCHAVVEVNQYSAGAAEQAFELPLQAIPTFTEDASIAVQELAELAKMHDVVVLCQNPGERQRMTELLQEHARGAEHEASIEIVEQYLHRGFVWGEMSTGATASERSESAVRDATGVHFQNRLAVQEVRADHGAQTSTTRPLALVPYHELLHRFYTRRAVRRISTGRALDTFLELQPGDFVVHRDHGIGKFIALQTLAGQSPDEEYLTIEFAGRTRIHVPAAQIDLIQKYVGALHGKPELSTVGGKKWKRQKDDVADAVRDLAAEMLRIQAAREAQPGIHYPADTAWQQEFEAEFPYEETEDQLAALSAIKRDMSSGRPMDRLVCGDVGFGKTELAIRAAFKAAEFGKQVAVLVPTTVLTEQHERTFRQRFADYPFRIESISRFKTDGEQRAVLDELRKGRVDVIIGTHRLLSGDVRFADLGLVVIDEEQRFGVEHKQRLLEFRMTADVLTLSATPIPRTLHMAMLGLRDISALSTPPLDRRAIVTEVIAYNPQRIKQAIQRELSREGQIFFVHNRVYDIKSVADDVQRLAPDARIVVGHGQMSPRELEKVMLSFMRREADILVSTTIIESGIDIPTANTMFINDAHQFGLSELHQLRGRVGRSKHRAYCYMLLPGDRVLSEIALKRMRAIESFSMLGAGFKIALRDLEIRGAGNLLGAEQSGHIAAVGYEMYCQLLEQAVRDLKNERPVTTIDTALDVGITGSLPRGYIPSDTRRMDAYRRIARAATVDELQQVQRDLESAYGPLPKQADLLLQVAELRLLTAQLGIRSLLRREQDVILRTARPGELEAKMKGVQGSLRVVGQPDDAGLTEVYFRPPAAFLEPATLLAVLRRRLGGSEKSTPMKQAPLGRLQLRARAT